MIAKEIAVQQKFDHPNITKMESFWYEPGVLYGGCGYILLEYCSRGNARCYAPRIGDPKKINEVIFLEQMLSALVYVHSKNVIHRYIKLENILETKESATLS